MDNKILFECIEATPQGFVLSVKVIPKGSKNSIEGVMENDMGQFFLKVKVTTVPEKGKANKAVIKLLAKTWRLPASSFSIIAGETNSIKKIAINGDSEYIRTQLEIWEREHRRD